MSDFQTIKISIDDRGVARLILARPEKHNCMNALMIDEIHQATEDLDRNAAVRVVILEAEGKSFCAGGDLNWMREQANKERGGKIQEALRLANMVKAFDDLTKPTIAKINGSSYGGGLGMVSVCDVVISSDIAKFCLTETKLGLIPATIGPYVVRRMGEGHTRRHFMSARPFDAGEGLRVGLVSQVVSSDKLDEAVEEEISYFLKCAPGAVAASKQLCCHLSRSKTEGQIEWTVERLADRWETDETQAGISAFFAKEKAPWV